MERHRCKLCYRKFANGRALGGHMRSHMMNLPLPIPPHPKPEPGPSFETESWPELSSPSPPSSSFTSSSSSSSSSEDEDEEEDQLGLADYKLRENPKKSIKLLSDVEFSSFGSSSVSVTLHEERETETERDLEREISESESSKINNNNNNPTRKRSKRQSGITFKNKKKKPTSIETTSSMSPASSVSEVTCEEDVALCLMMLSRDNWPAGAGGKGKFTCLTCNKVFRSYQALGGHRASHKKLRQPKPESESKPVPVPVPDSNKNPNKNKTHECPVCFRVFASAQALGGHKRTHSGGNHGGASRSNAVEQTPKKVAPAARRENGGFIDLNLPAPVDDDDHDDDISRVSLSAVSDPHF